MNRLRVALVQFSAGAEVGANLRRLDALLPAPGTVDLVALPEIFAVRGNRDDYRRAAVDDAQAIDDWLVSRARSSGAWVLAGSVIEATPAGLYNTALLFDPAGARVARYRKIHLFEASLEDGRTIREADVYQAGDQPVTATVAGWRCGLSICYDVRFPELYRLYSAAGADLLFVPANFTQRTGRDHWDVLVRARAIENQCFVVAPGQCGPNPRTGVVSHGHSLVAGPWGEVLATAGDEETTLLATLDPELLQATRRRVPALRHRRL